VKWKIIADDGGNANVRRGELEKTHQWLHTFLPNGIKVRIW